MTVIAGRGKEGCVEITGRAGPVYRPTLLKSWTDCDRGEGEEITGRAGPVYRPTLGDRAGLTVIMGRKLRSQEW